MSSRVIELVRHAAPGSLYTLGYNSIGKVGMLLCLQLYFKCVQLLNLSLLVRIMRHEMSLPRDLYELQMEIIKLRKVLCSETNNTNVSPQFFWPIFEIIELLDT